MKLTATILTLASLTSSQDCGKALDWLYLKTQADVAAIATCMNVLGSLSISGPITDLSPLANIKTVGLSIDINGISVDKISFQALTSINENLFIHNCNKLVGVSFPVLTATSGGIFIYDNQILPTLDGFSKLVNINPTSSPQFLFGLRISRNPRLTTLGTSFTNLKTIGNQFEISNCTDLINLSGLPKTPVSAVNVTLFGLDKVSDLSPLSNFESTADKRASLQITRMKAISTLKGLENLKGLADVIITYNPLLADVKAIANATIKGPKVNVDENPKLCDFGNLNVTALKVAGAVVKSTCGKALLDASASRLDRYGAGGLLVLAVSLLFLF